MKIICPECSQETADQRESDGYIQCLNCGQFFAPSRTVLEPAAEPETGVQMRREEIHYQAYKFTVFAGLFCGIGLLIAIASLAQAISGEEGAGRWFIVAASLIGTALWLYLIAQIIHIRANTEK